MLGYLAKTAQNLASLFADKRTQLDKDTLEELLIEADVAYDVIELLLEHLPKYPKREHVEVQLQQLFTTHPAYIVPTTSTTTASHAMLDATSLDASLRVDSMLDARVHDSLSNNAFHTSSNDFTPHITLIIGVNGAGKTTTIAKLANLYRKQGKSVLLGAGDTFRAAAIEQLRLWASKLDIPIIYSKQGGDPSAIVFDTISSALARRIEHIIIDTAGRLHTQHNLQKELEKIARTCKKAAPHAHLETLLILDGTQGSSALQQAKDFAKHVAIQGIIVTKLDGTSKGGVILSIAHELGTPIAYLGVGEREGDLLAFDRHVYIQGLLDCFYTQGMGQEHK